MTVTGHTRVFAIIADPVHHVRTPQALNALFAARGYDGIVV
ncbi:shikimate dehydrogenase, partial [Brucella abortus]